MPFLDLSTSSDLEVNLSLGIDLEIDLDEFFGLTAIGTLGISLTPTLHISSFLDVDDFELGLDLVPPFMRLGTESNLFLSATMSLGVDLEHPPLALALTFLGIFTLGIDLEAEAVFPEAETNELLITVNLIPTLGEPANYQEYKVRFKINGVEIPISAFSVKAPANKIGTDASVTLSRPSDRSLILTSSLYTLEIGVVVSGVTTWFTVAEGILTNDDLSIGWESGPTDSVQLSHSSGLAERVNISPLNTVVLYDSSDMDLSVEDFEPTYDMGGNPYPVTLIPIGGLTLYDVLNYAFSQCGLFFSTNLPNFKVKRLDIQIGQSYFQTVGQLFGVFNPIILERNGTVFILDSTMLIPGGFDAPTSITPSKYKVLSINRAANNINGYIVQYNENKDAWDDYDETEDVVVNEITDIDEGKTTILESFTTTRYYRRSSVPGVVVRAEVRKIISNTYVIDPVIYSTTDPVIINRTVEKFVYDATGKVLRRTKFESARIPLWIASTNPSSAPGDGKWEYQFVEVKYEQDDSEYKDNKFKRGTEYRQTFSQFTRALIYIDPDLQYETKDEAGVLDIDPDKEVPVKYKQEYVTAYRSGNLDEDGLTEYGVIATRFEKVTPIDKDFSRVQTNEVDFITKVVVVNVAEEQIGEISTSSQVHIQKEFIVFAPGATRDSRRLDTINIGEIPIVYGIALVQRKINKANSKSRQVSSELIGFDPYVDRGNTVKMVGRNSENLGNYLLEGYGIDGKLLGLPGQTIMMQVEGQQV